MSEREPSTTATSYSSVRAEPNHLTETNMEGIFATNGDVLFYRLLSFAFVVTLGYNDHITRLSINRSHGQGLKNRREKERRVW